MRQQWTHWVLITIAIHNDVDVSIKKEVKDSNKHSIEICNIENLDN